MRRSVVVLRQAALHAGPLRSSQPFLVIIDPLVSIALSVWLFTDQSQLLGILNWLGGRGIEIVSLMPEDPEETGDTGG